MPATANKGYEVQTTGTNINTWGQVLNDSMISFVDLNLGGVLTKTLGAVTENLTVAESRNGVVRLIGTLSANVLVTTLNQGFQIVENLTSGAFAVTFQRLGVGTPVIIPQGTSALIMTDAVAGTRIDADNRAEFAAGTAIFFPQAAAPLGWTAQVTANNRGIQVVSSGGGVLGGTATFTDTFGTRGLTGTVNGTAISEAQMASHRHFIANFDSVSDFPGLDASNQLIRHVQLGSSTINYLLSGSASEAVVGRTSPTGGGQAHDHGLSINNLNMNLAYITTLHCTKN